MSTKSVKTSWKNICTIGHIDHGKSTLMGYILYKLGEVSDNELGKISEIAFSLGKPSFRLAFILDSDPKERERGLSIITSYRGFQYRDKRFMVVDNPGHDKFLRNIVKGVSQSNYAIITIDASDWEKALKDYDRTEKYIAKDGIKITPGLARMYMFLANNFGIDDFLVVITKMDRVHYSENIFRTIEEKVIEGFKKDLESKKNINIIPTSINVNKLTDDNVLTETNKMKWWGNPPLIDYIYNLEDLYHKKNNIFRMPIDRFLSVKGQPTVLVGGITSGSVKINSKIFLLPESLECRVASIKMRDESYALGRKDRWGTKEIAFMNEIVGLGIRGVKIKKHDLKKLRGTLLVSSEKNLPKPCNSFLGNMFIYTNYHKLREGKFSAKIQFGSLSRVCRLQKIISRKPLGVYNNDTNNVLIKDDIAEVVISLDKPLPIDTEHTCLTNSRFAILDQNMIVSTGTVLDILE